MQSLSPDLTTNICNFTLSTCVYNASGARCTDADELYNLEKSSVGAVLTKSCTQQPREGNPCPRYYGYSGFSINSMGLPNHGITYYTDFATKRSNKTKPYILSICGLTPSENIALLLEALKCADISAIEINVSCPNVIGKPQLGYDFEGLLDFLLLIKEAYNTVQKIPLGLKLPPYFDFVHFETVANIITSVNTSVNTSTVNAKDDKLIQFIVCSNSLGNGLWIDSETETVQIKPKNGFGGIGGSAMKATTLANVHKFYQLLGDSVDIIGCGGVTSGKDIFDLLLVGAKAVQIGTQLMEHGIGIFDIYIKELSEIMSRKGYTTIHDFRGKIKYL